MPAADLPAGCTMHAPTPADLDTLAALLVAHGAARAGKAQWLPPAARAWIVSVWETPGFVVERDARVIVASDGQIVGYCTLWRPDEASGYFVASPRIAPGCEPLGLDVALLRWAEPLARQQASALPADVAAALNSWVDGPDPLAEETLTYAGFRLAQRYLRMETRLQAPPPAPIWPAGMSPRRFVAGADERAVYDLIAAAFAGVYSHDSSYDEWQRETFAPQQMDPTLWTLAAGTADGAALAGVVISREDSDDEGRIGWLEDVGVHPAWRKRGLGLAMLHHSFGVFYARGVTRCGLSVDARNASGAVRLYARAGMTPTGGQEIRYEMALH
ncbi:MAG TPA: GNAT family N-acetyltransferase [Ktedonobacterales bacterium]|nr:GNAT family N-acetyltransferase [Ktedonobacterales bacterium]